MQDGKHVILYVDDDPDFLESMRMVLEGGGYAVVTAGSAEEGLRAWREQKPDCIIVDLMMEEVDAGTRFVKDLKAEGNQAPILMLSSVGDQLALNIDYDTLGLAGVLQKPVDNDALLRTLGKKLGETSP